MVCAQHGRSRKSGRRHLQRRLRNCQEPPRGVRSSLGRFWKALRNAIHRSCYQSRHRRGDGFIVGRRPALFSRRRAAFQRAHEECCCDDLRGAPVRRNVWRPAYARYLGNAGSNFLSNTWRADSASGAGDAGVRILLGFAGKMGSNAFAEFWPDARKYIFRRKH